MRRLQSTAREQLLLRLHDALEALLGRSLALEEQSMSRHSLRLELLKSMQGGLEPLDGSCRGSNAS